jgi:5-dehydro-2-deoxygluconokinase
LVEIIAGKNGALTRDTVASALEDIYGQGIKPDWWKLEPQADAEAWSATAKVVANCDPYCRGVVVLGLEASQAELDRAFRACAGQKLVKGFAIGRSIFNEAARQWLSGQIDDAAAVKDMADRFASLAALWHKAHEKRAA